VSAAGLIDAARAVGIPFACLLLVWMEKRDARQAREEEREEFRKTMDEVTAALQSLRTEVRIAMTDGGHPERRDEE